MPSEYVSKNIHTFNSLTYLKDNFVVELHIFKFRKTPLISIH